MVGWQSDESYIYYHTMPTKVPDLSVSTTLEDSERLEKAE